MSFSKLLRLASVWLLSLGLSAVLVGAGQRWPEPLPIQSGWLWPLLLVVPLVTLATLLVRWPVVEGGESSGPMKERH